MTPIAAAVGFYGKLPCRGDFLRRRVPQELLDIWDEWLQSSLAHSRHALQDKWLDAYLTSPVWRFALAEGVCGTGAYAGVMVPSVDRVGRYFPLTIVAQWPIGESPIDAACSGHRWFEAAEALAMEAPDTSDLDAFDERVIRLAEGIDASGVNESASLQQALRNAEFPHREGQWHVPLETVGSLQRAVNAIAARELERTLRPLSMWWTDGSDRLPPAWLVARGLPAPESFAAMLSGDWAKSGWNSLKRGAPAGIISPAPKSIATPSAIAPAPGAVISAPPATSSRAAPTIPAELELSIEFDDLPGQEPVRALEEEIPEEPQFQIVAHHEPISRRWNAPPQSVFFVTRPEIGLWGVTTSGFEDARHAAAQAVADLLQNIPPTGTLSTMVEEVRRSLHALRRQLARQGAGAVDPYELARVVVFLSRDSECALVCSGDVQAVRCRALSARFIIGVADFSGNETLPRVRESSGNSSANSLLDIVTGADEPAIVVRYESLQPGDSWVLAAAPLFDQPQLSLLDEAMTKSERDTVSSLSAVRIACAPEYAKRDGPLPVLLLAASLSPVEA